jgi:hypothetical protein
MKCLNCGNETNSAHSKYCYVCSFVHQIRACGYEPEFELIDGEISSLVLTRSDIFERHIQEEKERATK